MAFVSQIWMSAFVPYVSLTAFVPQMWTSTFEPTFLVGFGNLPVQGRFCRNFQLIVMSLLLCRAGRVAGDLDHLGDPDCLRAPTRLCTATLGINHLFLIIVVSRLRNQVRRLLSERDTWSLVCESVHICDGISFELSTFFG
jgi:hypothetical protein